MLSPALVPESFDPASLDALPDAVLCLDAGRVISVANVAAAELLGMSSADLVGRSCADALSPRSASGRELLTAGWHPSTAMRSVSRIPEQEVRLRRPDGVEVRARVTGRY